MKKLQFRMWPCTLQFSTYQSGGRVAIQLIGTGKFQGEHIATASVNLPDEPMTEDEIAIKNYSENEGMLEFLADAGVIDSTPLRYVESGHVTIPICKLLIKS